MMKPHSLFRMSIALPLVFLAAAAGAAQKGAIDRISVADAHKMVKAGDALLVCSYEDDTCKAILLEGAILKSQFESKLAALPKTKPIIFYCAWPNEATSAGLAEKYREKGYTSVKALHGGVDAWKEAKLKIQAPK